MHRSISSEDVEEYSSKPLNSVTLNCQKRKMLNIDLGHCTPPLEQVP